jgi:hypothetical protein
MRRRPYNGGAHGRQLAGKGVAMKRYLCPELDGSRGRGVSATAAATLFSLGMTGDLEA